MKKLRTVITSALLCATMAFTLPAQVIASAEEPEAKQYISEVKVGMGETSEEAAKELLADGYTILTKDDGSYADLNEKAGTSNPFKVGPNQKIVYMGYKTTTDVTDAITDLAVMNMNGGYSFEDYESLMNKQMDTQIKPFVDRFIATLREYRENLKKPQDSINYKRADYYRKLLNKLTDDDCGGKPIGDLLVNETKYEMGDEAYNKLSDEEKKNHCDILTLLMQGNGQAVLLMETELTKAADAGENTWIDRFLEKDLEALSEEISNENPTLTPSEIKAELDKKYNDDAKKILEKWSAFGEVLAGYEDALVGAEEIKENAVDADAAKEKLDALTEDSTVEEVADVAADYISMEGDMVQSGTAIENIVVNSYLDLIKYGDGTLLEFFERDVSEFSDDETIRELYPIVDALSGGQLAGIDFLSIKDMLLMAFVDENGFNSAGAENAEPASIYQGVNREIYEVGGVALTNDALRAKARTREGNSEGFALSKLGKVLWISTCAMASAAGFTYAVSEVQNNAARYAERLKELEQTAQLQTKMAEIQEIKDSISSYEGMIAQNNEHIAMISASKVPHKNFIVNNLTNDNLQSQAEIAKLNEQLKLKESGEKLEAAAQETATKSPICKYLSIGFTVAMAVLAGISIYTTVTEMMEYYKVDFVPIPKYIVDEIDITATNEKGETVMIQNQTAYYKAALCNRTDGSTDTEKENHKILLDRGDLNGDVGKQWLALYSVKYVNGMPILADSLKVQTGVKKHPNGYTTGIHRFGEKSVYNLTNEYLCYNDVNKGTYVFFKNDTATVQQLAETTSGKAATTGSIFSGTSFAIGAAAGILIGILIAVLIVKARKKKDDDTAEAAE